jgi:methylmalonyl-CoA carboxyltransferase large subunit
MDRNGNEPDAMEELALGPALLLLPLSILAGYLAGSLTSRRTRREIDDLKTIVAGLQTPTAPVSATVVAPAVPVAAAPPAPVKTEAVPVPAPPVADEVTPEILMVLSAAVAAFLGKKARVRSARTLRPLGASAWAQQGRVFVQASHSLPHRPR